MTRVVLPTHLQSYTGGTAVVEVEGQTLREVMENMEAGHPGFWVRIIDEQDRIRPHIKCFVAGEQAWNLEVAITGEVQVVAALSGG